jgi:hypothetical protein
VNERLPADSFVTCPLCHTGAILTEVALSAGGAWCCVTCGAHWDSARVSTVTAYRAWVAEHRPASVVK